MQWPRACISNKALYEVCGLKPLSERVTYSRWKMLGHVLRMDDDNPAQLALYFAVESSNHMTGRIGRHQTNLLNIIRRDLGIRNIELNDIDDLYYLSYC